MMLCKLYKLLNNPLRVDLLVRTHQSCDGVNVGILADEMDQKGLKLSGVSQYLKQLESLHVIRRERAGRFVNYLPDLRFANSKVRQAVGLIVDAHALTNDLAPVFTALMNPFRARVIALIAQTGELSGEEICERTNHQAKYLKRDLQDAVDAGLLELNDSDAHVAVYRYHPPEDATARTLVELCF